MCRRIKIFETTNIVSDAMLRKVFETKQFFFKDLFLFKVEQSMKCIFATNLNVAVAWIFDAQ
jgi:hypothetical protein